MSNKTSPLTYAIWPCAMAIVIAVLGIYMHPSRWDYIISGIIWLIGIGIMLYQIQTGGDTNILPYIVMFLAPLVFGIWATSGPAV
jgi:hypothetical protein